MPLVPLPPLVAPPRVGMPPLPPARGMPPPLPLMGFFSAGAGVTGF